MKGTGSAHGLEMLRPRRKAMIALLCLFTLGMNAQVYAVTRDDVSAAKKEARQAAAVAEDAADNLQDAENDLQRLERTTARKREQLAELKQDLTEMLAEKEGERGFFAKMFKPDKEDLVKDINQTSEDLESLVSRRVQTEQQVAAARRELQQSQQLADQKQQRVQQLEMALEREEVRKQAAPKPQPQRVTRKAQPTAPAKEVKPVQPRAANPPSDRTTPAAPKRQPARETVSEPIPWGEEDHPQKTPVLAGARNIEPSVTYDGAQEAAQEAGNGVQFDVAMVSGDKDVVEDLDIWKQWESHIPFNEVSSEDIKRFHQELTEALQQEGYVFAKVDIPTRIWPTGIFLAKVDAGPLGNVVVRGHKHYSAEQIVGKLSENQDKSFNYAQFYQNLYDLNARPDISVNTRLKPVVQDGRRVINAELEVEDNLPIHGAFEASNTGTEHTNDWRFQTTLQHVNLTKHDDVLTLDWVTSPDIEDVNAYSGSYFLPFGEDYSLNLFGGYSSSDIDDVLPQLDVRGEGHFAGGQLTKTLFHNDAHRIQLSAGWLYQRLDSRQIVGGMALQDRDIEVSMPMLTIGYAGQGFDALNGRNFISNTILVNFADKFGSSPEEDFNSQGTANGDGDFVIDRFQFARFQRLATGGKGIGANWSLYLKLDGQVSTDTLVPQLRKTLGGADSVRGYEEQEIAGDDALVATLELRTPVWQNFIPGLKKSDEYLENNPDAWEQHRLQFLVFGDFGYARLDDALPGEQDNDSVWSVGAGLRLSVTRYSQLRFDLGVPLEETEDTNSGHARGHFSLQLQF